MALQNTTTKGKKESLHDFILLRLHRDSLRSTYENIIVVMPKTREQINKIQIKENSAVAK
jgi:hypothetical protein